MCERRILVEYGAVYKHETSAVLNKTKDTNAKKAKLKYVAGAPRFIKRLNT